MSLLSISTRRAILTYLQRRQSSFSSLNLGQQVCHGCLHQPRLLSRAALLLLQHYQLGSQWLSHFSYGCLPLGPLAADLLLQG
mgnify:CR=1 FL=1